MRSLSQSHSSSNVIDGEANFFTPVTNAYSDLTLNAQQHSQHLPLHEIDPSLSQQAMNKLVAIHEAASKSKLSHPNGGKLVITPSIGYSSSDHSLNHQDINKSEHDLHIFSPLHVHLNTKKSQTISITISDDTVTTQKHKRSSNVSSTHSAKNDVISPLSPLQKQKKKKKRKKRHKQTAPSLALTATASNHSIGTVHTTDTQLYGGPKPYFIKRYPKSYDSISPQQSLDSYCGNPSDNEWFNNVDGDNNNNNNNYVRHRKNNPFSSTNKSQKSITKSHHGQRHKIYKKYKSKRKLKDIQQKSANDHAANEKSYHFIDGLVGDDFSCLNSPIIY